MTEKDKKIQDLEKQLQKAQSKIGGRPPKAFSDKATKRIAFYVTPSQFRQAEEIFPSGVGTSLKRYLIEELEKHNKS